MGLAFLHIHQPKKKPWIYIVLLLSALKKIIIIIIIIIPYYTQRKLPTTCLYSLGHAITANKQDLLSDVCT